ncbi:MAG: helix-turn-helix domain-containing protein [Planctomycetes bacterium]|nr:helix-turn-helix domain-containing protein [Planctomycetota bacterium]
MPPDLKERLELAVRASGLSQAELCRRADLSHSAISNIMRGVSSGSRSIASLAAALGVDAAWLATGMGEAPKWAPASAPAAPEITLDKPREVPVLGSAGAADEGQRGTLYEQADRVTLSPHLALIEVRGGSAYPVIYDGQRAIINLKRKTNPNNLAVVVMAGSDEVLIKRWCPQPDGDHVVLASPDGGKHSLVVHLRDIRHCWPVVGVLYE